MSTRIRFPPDGLATDGLSTSTMAKPARKSTQRARLLNGMAEATNRRGYTGATVSAVIAEAGVSRPTFYDYFVDRDDCFRAAIEAVQMELLDLVRHTVEAGEGEDAFANGVRALVSFAVTDPSSARFLMAESLAGGPDALAARDEGISAIAAAIGMAAARAAAGAPAVDLEGRVLVGSVYRMLATRLRRGEAAISKLSEDLIGWVRSYQRPADHARWQTLQAGMVPGRSPHVPEVPLQQMPSVFPPGRPRVPVEQIAENHRMRILYAVARLAEEKGYAATTVADITRLASVDGRVFYKHFADKQDAFAAVHELGFQQVMDVTAKAFFAGASWPERSWEGGRALTQLLQANPLVAHVGFVEAYAVGPAAVQRIEDSHIAFMFFLQEGLVQADQEPPPSRVAMEAIIAAIFEVIYLQARRGDELEVAGMLGQIAHLWLAPFLGVAEADAFIDSQMRPAKAPRSRKR